MHIRSTTTTTTTTHYYYYFTSARRSHSTAGGRGNLDPEAARVPRVPPQTQEPLHASAPGGSSRRATSPSPSPSAAGLRGTTSARPRIAPVGHSNIYICTPSQYLYDTVHHRSKYCCCCCCWQCDDAASVRSGVVVQWARSSQTSKRPNVQRPFREKRACGSRSARDVTGAELLGGATQRMFVHRRGMPQGCLTTRAWTRAPTTTGGGRISVSVSAAEAWGSASCAAAPLPASLPCHDLLDLDDAQLDPTRVPCGPRGPSQHD
ncbi:hypothetical protein BC628DRAFT_1202185 [Trametes gibbosa]|nr:hypothetical protein BC628DRAFT_1202185 [Trametes gibbosa]